MKDEHQTDFFLIPHFSVGPEGVEPSPYRLKGGYAAITPQPQIGEGAAFPVSAVNHGNLLSNKKSQGLVTPGLWKARQIKPGVTSATDTRAVQGPIDDYQSRISPTSATT